MYVCSTRLSPTALQSDPQSVSTRRSARNRMNLNHSAASATEVPADSDSIILYILN